MWKEAGEVGRRSTKKGPGTWFLSLSQQGPIQGTPCLSGGEEVPVVSVDL